MLLQSAEAALSASVPQLVNAALCQYVGGHLSGVSLAVPCTMLGVGLGIPLKAPLSMSLGCRYLAHSRSTENM